MLHVAQNSMFRASSLGCRTHASMLVRVKGSPWGREGRKGGGAERYIGTAKVVWGWVVWVRAGLGWDLGFLGLFPDSVACLYCLRTVPDDQAAHFYLAFSLLLFHSLYQT